MSENKSIALFESKNIRRYYDATTETWYFSLVDIVEALTDSSNPTDYLKKLRKRDVELGNYLGTNCPHVEMITNTLKFGWQKLGTNECRKLQIQNKV